VVAAEGVPTAIGEPNVVAHPPQHDAQGLVGRVHQPAPGRRQDAMLQQRHWGIRARQTKHAEDVVVVGEHKVFFHCNAILLQVILWGMLAEPEIISNFFIQPRTENLKFTKAATGSPLPKSLKATSW